jgi:hypothetical protein
MQSNLNSVIELLKKEVLTRAGISIINQANLPELAVQILAATGQQLSQVALSRMYGFMESKFGPSLFTLQVLSLYCDYQSWETFIKLKGQDVLLRDN